MESLIKLLSYYRKKDANNISKPQSLTRRALYKLLLSTQSPDMPLSKKIFHQELEKLEVQGEILKGARKRYCVAPPMVIAESPSNLTRLQFKGDRCYLKLVHDALEIKEESHATAFSVVDKSFEEVQKTLAESGIRLVTLENLVEWLPQPQKPRLYRLSKVENIFTQRKLEGKIQKYSPKYMTQSQLERWELVTDKNSLKQSSLLCYGQYHGRKYFWFESSDQTIYSLPNKSGALAMFWLDKTYKIPLQLSFLSHSANYELDLRDTFIPYEYYKFIGQRSEEHVESKNIRIIEPKMQLLVKTALEKLGCCFA